MLRSTVIIFRKPQATLYHAATRTFFGLIRWTSSSRCKHVKWYCRRSILSRQVLPVLMHLKRLTCTPRWRLRVEAPVPRPSTRDTDAVGSQLYFQSFGCRSGQKPGIGISLIIGRSGCIGRRSHGQATALLAVPKEI